MANFSDLSFGFNQFMTKKFKQRAWQQLEY